MANDKAFKVKNGLELGAYNAVISSTAVDVFVYDTSKDSDGGAWRKRTQHTSWYNETLNTATRGSRREFPAVAVIVAESGKVTIYDGDDPALPMWMVFSGAFANMMNQIGPIFVAILNGQMVAGSNTYDISVTDFLGDRGLNSLNYRGYNGVISERNATKAFTNYTATWRLKSDLVNRGVNDVAMTVLPDAPIDPATGLPVPTIAVATDGGVSVIKDDGTVVDIVHTDTAETLNVWLRGNLLIYNAAQFLHARPIPSEDISAGARYVRNSADVWFAPRFASATYAGPSFHLHQTGNAPAEVLQVGQNVSIANSDRLNRAIVSDEYNGLDALYNFTTSTYNTGWMNGDIKGAFLADTDDTDLVASGELVTNGTFDTDVSGWTDSSTTGGSISWNASGYLDINSDGVGVGHASQIVATEVGKTYTVSYDVITAIAGNVHFYVGTSLAGSQYYSDLSNVGSHTFTFTATTTTAFISIREFTSGTSVVDNISVKLADADRSVNNKGLIVNGTVTRSPVATGAELVAYSGFSASNYLEQPYNSDLDFGTGDFCVMGWVNLTSTTTQYFFDRGTTGGRLAIGVSTSWWYSCSNPAAFSNSGVTAKTGLSHIVLLRESGVLKIFVDGIPVYSVANTANISATEASRIGIRNDGVGSVTGSLALLRISATAPTAEAIKKIYEDEKVLFQENAKAVLAGTSDAVTALAYDDTTEELLVGTSQYTSVFRGLRRVDEISGSASAISASNGLRVIED